MECHIQPWLCVRPEIRLIAVGLLCLALSSVAPAGAITGYSIYGDGDLVAIDLATGVFEVIGATGLGAAIALADDPAGELYAVVQDASMFQLYRIDRATAASTLVGDVGDDLEVTGLTFDADGTLWMAAGDALYTVDPTTATLTLVGSPDHHLLALAARDGVLYSVVEIGLEPDLVTVDPATAATTVIADVPEFSPDGLSPAVFSMAFDRRGTLWVSVILVPPILPPDLPQAFFRIAEVTAPAPEIAFWVSTPPAFIGLAIVPGVFDPVVEIPTLGRFGWTVLATLLLSGGLLTIRRRHAAARRVDLDA